MNYFFYNNFKYIALATVIFILFYQSNIELFDMLNTFAGLYDDNWVLENLKKIESQILIYADIKYDSFNDWITIKKKIAKSQNINFFKILRLSNEKSLIKMKVINEKKLLSELENNNFNIKSDNNIWNIKKNF